MREAGQRLTQLTQSLAVQDAEWGALVEGTKWLTHVRLVLNAAYRTAHAVLREGASVLLHCSHGWDRTSQVASLAQVMLDPYYRTFDGFAVLVEKDWCAFGHPFHLRTAHGLDRNARTEEQLAPIFLQFLDAVSQLQRQHPALFEFGGRYLLALADHLHDCRFGSFLCNSPRERAGPPLRTPAGSAATASIWTYLAAPAVRRQLRNPLYLDPNPAEGSSSSSSSSEYPHAHRLLDTPLPALLRRVALWGDYWLRWSAKPCHPPEAYAAMRRLRERGAAAAAARAVSLDPDLAMPWAWLEEEAERALYGTVLGAGGGEEGEGDGRGEEDLIDLAAVEGSDTVKAAAVSVVVAPRQEASEGAMVEVEGEEEDEEDADGFVVTAPAEAEAEEIASEFM